MVMEPSFTMARLSGKLDELKDVIDVTCDSTYDRSAGCARPDMIRLAGLQPTTA
jgi:hypothetical protein